MKEQTEYLLYLYEKHYWKLYSLGVKFHEALLRKIKMLLKLSCYRELLLYIFLCNHHAIHSTI